MVEWVNLFSDKQNYVHCCEPSAKVPMLLDRGTPQFLRVRRKRSTAVGECGGEPPEPWELNYHAWGFKGEGERRKGDG
jgi:hypothetical protein